MAKINPFLTNVNIVNLKCATFCWINCGIPNCYFLLQHFIQCLANLTMHLQIQMQTCSPEKTTKIHLVDSGKDHPSSISAEFSFPLWRATAFSVAFVSESHISLANNKWSWCCLFLCSMIGSRSRTLKIKTDSQRLRECYRVNLGFMQF